jgi:hypothetical protein
MRLRGGRLDSRITNPERKSSSDGIDFTGEDKKIGCLSKDSLTLV